MQPSIQFPEKIKVLFSLSEDISGQRFSYEQLSILPDPVQRYFKHVLKDDQPYISYTRLIHDGQFKTNLKNDWVNIEGEEYFTTEKPGFLWKGKTKKFSAYDMFIAGKGRLLVMLFSIFKIADGKGEKYDQGELLRWLGESVWFPTNLLPNKNLQWFPIDNFSAKLIFNYNNLSLFYIVRFNEADEIAEIETQRYMGNKNLQTWVGKLSEYKFINEILIPTTIEAAWRLEQKDYNYAMFKLKTIEYNIPEKF